MIDLIGVELRRVFARRLVRFLAIFALAGIVLAGILTFVNTSDEVKTSQFGQPPEQALADCIAGRIPPPVPSGVQLSPQQLQQVCTDFYGNERPLEGFVQDDRFHLSDLPGILGGLIVPLTLLGWVLAASSIGADFRAGTIGVLLTWEPRRWRVMLAKAIAAVALSVTFAIAVFCTVTLALLPSHAAHGAPTTIEMTADERNAPRPGTADDPFRAVDEPRRERLVVSDAVGIATRGTALVIVASLIGFSLASMGRNTAAATAIGFVYFMVLEGGVLNLLGAGLRRWTFVPNALIFVTSEEIGILHGRTPGEAGIILGAYALAALAIAFAVFQARDVTA